MEIQPLYRDSGQGDKLETTFEVFMKRLGLDTDTDHLCGTPRRVVKMYRELFIEEPWSFTTFPKPTEHGGIVLVRDIPFTSLCAHHWLPFTGVGHVAYIPSDKIAGLSKLARALQHFCYGPTVQEEIGERTAAFLEEHLKPIGVAVVLKANHSCMEIRGVKAHGSETVTSHLKGCFYKEAEARAEFFSLLKI